MAAEGASDGATTERLVDEVYELLLELHEGQAGVPMGALVDRLEARGHDEDALERAVWQLIEARRATPNGFVRRVVRRAGPGRPRRIRTYEFTLIPWSPERDRAPGAADAP